MPPSATTLADKGLKAFSAADYATAITLYSSALEINPEAPDYYLKRSISYQRSAQYQQALRDAECALVLAHRRGRREMMGSAQLRRGIALQLLGRLGDANLCLDAAERMCSSGGPAANNEKNMVGIWKKKLEIAFARLAEDDVAREVLIEEIPVVDIPKPVEAAAAVNPEEAKKVEPAQETKSPTTSTPSSPPSPPPPPSSATVPAGVTTHASKIRHEWYQTSSHVVLTLYVKGVPKDKASIEIQKKTLAVSFPLSSGNDFVFDIDPFWDEVVPSESNSSILSTKVEVKLLKASPGKKWADLEGAPEEVVGDSEEKTKGKKPETDKPVYPSSAKTGPKDWDKLAADLSAKAKSKAKGKGRDDGDEGGDDDMGYDSDEGGDPVNFFFKKLYKGADEDTRRAMMKSYIESNGTALSTNWAEVGKAKVETSPPEGMTAKKWGE